MTSVGPQVSNCVLQIDPDPYCIICLLEQVGRTVFFGRTGSWTDVQRDCCRDQHSLSAEGQSVSISSFVGHVASNELRSYSALLKRKRSYGQKVNNDSGPGHMQFHLEILKFEFCFVLFLRLSGGSRLASNP